MLEHADVGLDNWTGLILSYLCQTEYIQIRPDRVRPMQGSYSQTCQSISSSSVGGGVLIMAEAEAKAPSWVEAEAMEERLSMIKEKIRLLSMTMNNEDFSGMSEAERAAKQAKGKEERLALFHECTRLNSLKKAPDFSGMTEAERAAEAERRRQRDLQEARRLLAEGHPMGPRRRPWFTSSTSIPSSEAFTTTDAPSSTSQRSTSTRNVSRPSLRSCISIASPLHLLSPVKSAVTKLINAAGAKK
jgi:hypothetical protein